MTSTTNICVGCGFCCDGHLFDHALMKPEEADHCTDLGMEVRVDPEGDYRFVLPCPRYGDGCCTVYDERPSICSAFRCRLMRDHSAGRVSSEDALAVIAQVRALDYHGTLRPVLDQFADVPGGSAATRLANALQTISNRPEAAELRLRHGPVLVRAAALVQAMRSHFLSPPKKDETPPGDGMPESR